MLSHELILGIRNILLMQLVLLLMMPSFALEVRRELRRVWRSVNAPFLRKKTMPKKGSFWEIDLTKFEP